MKRISPSVSIARFDPDWETFSNYFGTVLRLSVGIAAITLVLPRQVRRQNAEDRHATNSVNVDRAAKSLLL
jgi:hypothetical protein